MLIGWTPIIEGKAIKYTIKNFIKGLVDPDSQANLSDDYRQKCSELKNFYITQNDTLQIRPPMEKLAGFDGEIDDVVILEDGRFVVSSTVTPHDYFRVLGKDALRQLTYLLPKSGSTGFNPIGLRANINADGTVAGGSSRQYNNRLAGGILDEIIVHYYTTSENYNLIPNNLLIDSGNIPAGGIIFNDEDWVRNGLMRFINVMKSVDIYSADGTYEKGWLFGAQSIKQSPDHDYTPTTGTQPLFERLAKRSPYLFDIFPGVRNGASYESGNTTASIEKQVWDNYLVKLGSSTDLRSRERSDAVSDTRYDLRNLYSNYIRPEHSDNIPVPEHDLILNFVLEDYRNDEIESSKMWFNEYNPIDLGVFNAVMDTSKHVLRRMSLKQYSGAIDGFCSDPDILLDESPIKLEPTFKGGVGFSKFGITFTVEDDKLTNDISESILPLAKDVAAHAAQLFNKRERDMHKVFDLPMKVVVCTPNTGGGYQTSFHTSYVRRGIALDPIAADTEG